MFRERLSLQPTTIDLDVLGSTVHVDLAPGRLKPTVAGLGPVGTYTEEAREIFLHGNEQYPFQKDFLGKNIDVVKRVNSGEYDMGVVPVENLLEGDVVDVWKTLLTAENTRILSELILPIEHMLIGRNGETFEDIQEVYSHIQALGQSRDFLEHYFHSVRLIPTDSTAKAVEMIQEIPHAAAIGSKRAAEINNLPIYAANIGDNPHNATRFYLIGRGETEPTGNDITTAMVYPQENRKGLLRDCLDVMARYDLDLTNIRSYPTRRRMGEYGFLTSFTGHYQDGNVSEALQVLARDLNAPSHILGSYQRAIPPAGVYEPGFINGD